MHTDDQSGRAAALVLELASGTVILHGEEVELPPREFKLLAALASRTGEPISSAELMRIVWAEDAEWTPPHNLIVLVSKLRRLIDGPSEFGKNIRNRRRRGYVLDLEPSDVLIVDSEREKNAPEQVIHLDEIDVPAPEASVAEEAQPRDLAPSPSELPVPHQGIPVGDRRRNRPRVAAVAGLAFALVAASWSAGYVLSSRDAAPSATSQADDAEASREEETTTEGDDQAAKPPKDRRRQRQAKAPTTRGAGNRRKAKTGGGSTVIAAPPPSTTSGYAARSAPRRDTQGSHKTAEKEPAPPPALPPAPTRYLYHLIHPGNGDHFVTTDSATASEQEAKGYEGGAIARVYTYREQDTKAIQTNRGTAYIFVDAAPKTEPASRTLALWYSTNGAGDFFFTTSESEATQAGWSGHRIGFVRAL